MGPIAEEELVRMLQGEGLVCCSTHDPSDRLFNETAAVIERLRKLNCRLTACPYPGGARFDTLEDVRALAGRLNRAGRLFREAGITFCYHNHDVEFRRVDGRTVLDLIYAETDPHYLQGEIDTYWVQHGGGDPVDWCRRLAGRLPAMHLKDYVINAEGRVGFAEIGRGNLNWPAILAAAEAGGCESFIVEQDTCAGDPFDALRISFEYLRDQFCRG
jgi:sugar phosphate isomerase/epimerase